jgi:predicted RNase H-like HicB family nuclease
VASLGSWGILESAIIHGTNMNDRYEIVIYWSQEDSCFLAEVPEIPKLITDGTTRSEALANAEEMISAYLETAKEAG